ncbi:MAG: glycosyltransferase family 2 protein [Eubacteriales bacterium]|nr:glycosyltransferase family 2 protein [Eubacteriales bacterium]
MDFIVKMNTLIITMISVLYVYQMFYIAVVFIGEWVQKRREKKQPDIPVKQHRFAAIISARNESNVIGQLLDTIRAQKYPAELLDAIVIADNCTDDTAQVAREHGAIVYERFNKEKVGKGFALNYAFHHIAEDYGDSYYDAYVIIDADNLLDENYFAEMNKTFCKGYRIMTSYRNSKNFASNWISAGYSLWFLREAKFLNNARMMLGTSCAVSGTGFLVSSEIIRERGGWNYHLLTEDIEFTVDTVIRGENIGYCAGAMLYDEQPTTFQQSWTQRMRWAKGFYQIVANYGGRLSGGIVKNRRKNPFACFDLTMTVMPAMLITVFILISDLVLLLMAAFGSMYMPHLLQNMLGSLVFWLGGYYSSLFFMGAVTMITERKKIRNCPWWKRILYTFTFPFFQLTYLPIALAALFKKVEWKPIRHEVAKSLDEVR